MMRKKVSFFVAIAFAIVLASGSASATMMHSWDLNQQYIDNRNDSVGGLFSQNGSDWYLSSVVNLGGGWGLTAAHVIDIGNPYGGYFGENVYSPDASSFITDYFVHPDWGGTVGQGTDLALVRFSDPMSSVTSATVGTDAPEVGDPLHFSGYGQPGTAGNPSPQDGYGRGWNGTLDEIGWGSFVTDDHLSSGWTHPSLPGYNPLGGLGALGDSGGGIFDDNGFLIAIITGVTFPGANIYSVDTFGIMLDDGIQSWISDTTGSGPAPVPEPATFLLFGTGLLGIAGVARKKKKA